MSNTSSTAPAEITSTGSVALFDDREEPLYLSPAEALALSEWLVDQRDTLEQAQRIQRTVDAYRDVASLVAAGLPAPSIYCSWDGRLDITLPGEPAAFTAWSERLVQDGATVDTRLHPTLGSRSVIETETLRVEGPWSIDTVLTASVDA